MRLVLLGCGTSSGVPRLGPDWGRCNAANPRNRRRRVSLLVEHEGRRLLVDSGPDVREQLLDAEVDRIDAVLYTHDHADHSHGIDDLRVLAQRQGCAIDCYMNRATQHTLEQRFSYFFHGKGSYPAAGRILPIDGPLEFGDLVVRPFRQLHGDSESLGFRFEAGGRAIGYSTDLHALPEESWPEVQGLDLWIVDCLRREPHPSHSHLAQTLSWIERARPAEAWLTHLDTSMDHDELAAQCPAGVSPGFDGRCWETAG